VVENVSNTQINASGGDHMIFIGGSGDILTATGGNETIQAYQGGNSITSGSGDDTIRFAGAHNVIDAGGGANVLADSGTDNTLVLPAAAQGTDDIFGYLFDNGDSLDLRPLLASTSWNGDPASIGNFIHVAMSGTNALVRVNPSGATGGAVYPVATLEGTGPMLLSTLLSHSMT
jgi:hypothetical protein